MDTFGNCPDTSPRLQKPKETETFYNKKNLRYPDISKIYESDNLYNNTKLIRKKIINLVMKFFQLSFDSILNLLDFGW